jgi:large subunit ribosomal protein L24
MKIKKGDKVKILSGKDKGKVAVVLKVLKNVNKIVVEGVNIAKKHVKPGAVSKEGGIIKIEKPIDASNVMYFDEKTNKPVRLGYKLVNGKKYRISKKTGEIVDKKL